MRMERSCRFEGVFAVLSEDEIHQRLKSSWFEWWKLTTGRKPGCEILKCDLEEYEQWLEENEWKGGVGN
jgi:hypothetical protein